MTNPFASHLWAVTDGARIDGVQVPEPDCIALCHRRRSGPYTGGGQLLRHVVPELLKHHPDLVALRATEVDAIAPDLSQLLPRPPQTLTNTASPEERTRFYAVGRTQRLAHGAAELVLDWARLCHPQGVLVAFRELEHADPTDQELVATLLRRCDPRVITLLVETISDVLDSALASALSDFSRPVGHGAPAYVPAGDADTAQAFVDSDGLGCSPAAERAYQDLPDDQRARLHSARAAQLAALVDPTIELGSVCYHLERGVDRATIGAKTLHDAVDRCFELGYYHAAMDFAERGRRLVSQADAPKLWCAFTHKIGACLSYLGRGNEALPYLAALRQATTNPVVHMSCSYMTAMLFTRLLPREEHDEDLALQWVNNAVAFADTLSEKKDRVFFGAFMRNARALVDVHRGDTDGALAQVNRAIEITDAALQPNEHMLHRSVLRYNRAQVLSAVGDYAGSLADYDEAIRRDPDYGDYYFDRAAVYRSAGEYERALADYATAMRLTPPFYEAHYNRADLLRELGEFEAALQDLDYALELEPGHVESLLGRADLSLAMGNLDSAAVDIDAGLAIEPDNAHLHSARASLLAETGDTAGALAEYAVALEKDPRLIAAWVNRAVLRYSEGHIVDAVGDLDHALAIREDPVLRLNRAIALQDIDRHADAIEDLDAVLGDPAAGAVADTAEALYRRGLSRYAQHDVDGALQDWDEHLTRFDGDESPHAAEIAARSGYLRASRMASADVA